MANARTMFFLINERQDRWWLPDGADRAGYARVDATPLPAEPQRERTSHGERLAFRLRLIIRPSAG